MADELYQEFFLSLCEITDKRLEEAYKEGYLEVFCVGTINNIWGKRDRVKTYATGSTHPLHEISNTTIQIVHTEEENKSGLKECRIEGSKLVYDPGIDHLYNKASDIIEQDRVSCIEMERFNSRVFLYSNTIFKSPRQFAKRSKIPYSVTLAAYNNYKETLKKRLCNISL
jgi:hypothetical protein